MPMTNRQLERLFELDEILFENPRKSKFSSEEEKEAAQKEYRRLYLQARKKITKEYNKQYKKTHKELIKKHNKKYLQSEKGKASRKRIAKKFTQSEHGQILSKEQSKRRLKKLKVYRKQLREQGTSKYREHTSEQMEHIRELKREEGTFNRGQDERRHTIYEPYEDEMIMIGVDFKGNYITRKELAILLGRTTGAIGTRRNTLKKRWIESQTRYI